MEIVQLPAQCTPGMSSGGGGGGEDVRSDDMRVGGEESTIPDHLSSSIGSPGKRTHTFGERTGGLYDDRTRDPELKKCFSGETRPPLRASTKFSNSVQKPSKAEVRREFFAAPEAPMTPQDSSNGSRLKGLDETK